MYIVYTFLAATALAPQATDSLALYLRAHPRPAVEVIAAAAREHPIVFVGDVHPAAAPKLLIAALVRRLASDDRLSALGLEVPMTEQPAIDAYLASDPEDTGILERHPLLLRAIWGVSREYLDIYRAVWAVNHARGAGERIRILGLDVPTGPPIAGSRQEALARYVNRDAVMEETVRRWRQEHPDGRLLVFIGDLHTLKDVQARLELDDTFDRLIPLAARLAKRWPGQVYAVLSDAAVVGHPDGATRVFPAAQGVLGDPSGPEAMSVAGPLADVVAPLRLEAAPGTPEIDILPPSYTLARVADLYVYFGTSPPLTPLRPGPR